MMKRTPRLIKVRAKASERDREPKWKDLVLTGIPLDLYIKRINKNIKKSFKTVHKYLYNTTQHNTTQHNTTQHNTTQHTQTNAAISFRKYENTESHFGTPHYHKLYLAFARSFFQCFKIFLHFFKRFIKCRELKQKESEMNRN